MVDDAYTMTLDEFVDTVVPDEDASEVIRTVVKHVESGFLSDARAYVNRITDHSQAGADRIVQEIVLRDDRITDDEALERVPLVEVDTELEALNALRYLISCPSDEDCLYLERQQRIIADFEPDGRIVDVWYERDAIEIQTEAELDLITDTVDAYFNPPWEEAFGAP